MTGPTTSPSRLCDTTDMVIVHRAFRREFRLLPDMTRAVAASDVQKAGSVAAHAHEMIDALHHHHKGEDDLLWPLLRARAELDRELIERMESQHEAIAAVLGHVATLLPQWGLRPDPARRDLLSEQLVETSRLLTEHLADEEQHVLPLAEKHITATEWAQLGRRGIAAIPKNRLLVFLGHMLEEASPIERAHMLQTIPVPGRIAFRAVGERKHRKEVTALRAGLG